MNYLSMLAPIVPIMTEEIWNHTPEIITKGLVSPVILGWYKYEEEWDDKALVEDFGQLEMLSSAVKASIERARNSR